MKNSWDEFWNSGSVGDYLRYCNKREDALTDEGDSPEPKCRAAIPVIKGSDERAKKAVKWDPPRLS